MNMLRIFIQTSALLAAITSSTAYANVATNMNSIIYKGNVTITVDLELQGSRSATDVLFVVDNSGSMDPHQVKLAAIADQFALKLASQNRDFHVGVITTDSGRLYGVPRFISGSDPNSLAALKKNMQTGTDGNATETPFQSLMDAFSSPLLSTHNSSFLRDGANLEIIFVTDTEDQSSIVAADLYKHLSGLGTNGKKVVAHGILADGSSNKCPDEREVPTKLQGLIALTGGTVHDICSSDFAAPMDVISNSILANAAVAVRITNKVTRIPLFTTFQYVTLSATFGKKTLAKGNSLRGYVWDSSANEIILGTDVDWSGEALDTPLVIKFTPTNWEL